MTGAQLERFGGAFGFEGVSTTSTSLTVGRDLTRSDWDDLIVGLVASARALPWFIGDALAYGEHQFGESYAQISVTLEQHGLVVAPHTLTNWVSVATRVLPSRRRDDLPFSTHAEVAKLEPAR